MTDHEIDCRSALIFVEPIFGPGRVQWNGMAFVAGATVKSTIGSDRTRVLEECIAAVEATGVDVEAPA